jgi:SPP1 gp7 family putative phage head morphogenesis protein
VTVLDDLTAATVPTEVHHQGMVALIPEDRELDRLVLDGGEARDQLHLTLLFLGEATDLPDDVYHALQSELASRAEDLTLLQGDAFAVSQFNPHGDEPALVLGVGGAWLTDLRGEALQAVHDAAGPHGADSSWQLPEQHQPWVAHLTLAYDPTPDQFAAALERTGPVMFDRLRLAVGDETTDFELSDGRVLLAAGEATSEGALERRAARFEEVVSKALRRAVRAGTRSLGEVLTAAGGWLAFEAQPDAVSLDDLAMIEEAWRLELLTTVEPALARLWELGAADARTLVEAAVERTPVTLELRSLQAERYLSEATNRLSGIGTDLWRQTRLELVEGLAEGDSIDMLTRRVRSVLASTDVRAKTIARTEVIGASNAGSLAQMRAAGADAPVAKTWLATGDARTRPSHREADGQLVLLEQQFEVGGATLDHPGDPAGPAREVVNCRCTVTYQFEDDLPEGVTLGALAQGAEPQ